MERSTTPTRWVWSRIYLCRVRHSDSTAWPEHLRDVVGWFCYDRDKHPDKARPFTWMGARHDLDEYVNLLTDVSGEMMQRLRALKGILDEQRRRYEQARKYTGTRWPRLCSFMAVKQRRCVEESFANSLQKAGFAVNPDGPVPIPSHGGLDPDYQIQLKESDGLLLLGAEGGPRSTPTSSSSGGTIGVRRSQKARRFPARWSTWWGRDFVRGNG